MYGIAAQTQTRRLCKKYNKEWLSGKALAFGVRSKGHCLRCQSSQASHGQASALASDLLKRNASFKNSMNRP